MTRHRYDDTRSIGSSRLIPFLPGENAKDRHARRLAENLAARENMEQWCRDRGVCFRVTNRGHHWLFTLPLGEVADWWPSSAKLVWNKQFAKGIHVHDYEQAKKVIGKRLP